MCTIDACKCKSIKYYKVFSEKPVLEEIYHIIFYECGKVEIKTERFYYYSTVLKNKSIEQNIYIDTEYNRIYDVLNSYRLKHPILKDDIMLTLFCTILGDNKKVKNLYQLAQKFFQLSKI